MTRRRRLSRRARGSEAAEYKTIAGAALTLQRDSPDLRLDRHMMVKDRSDADDLVAIERHVDVLNHALRNVPA